MTGRLQDQGWGKWMGRKKLYGMSERKKTTREDECRGHLTSDFREKRTATTKHYGCLLSIVTYSFAPKLITNRFLHRDFCYIIKRQCYHGVVAAEPIIH